MSLKTTAHFATLTIVLSTAPLAAQQITPPAVPTDIEVPAGSRPFLRGHAIGTQNYICAATLAGYKWVPIGPQATLFNDDAEQNLTHFQSKNPFRGDMLHATWQHSRDTSAVWATKFAGSTDPSYVSPDAIEWLRLDVTGALPGPTGGDRLTGTIHIHRVNTVGGKEPATACTAALALVNTRQLVDYEADYYFYK